MKIIVIWLLLMTSALAQTANEVEACQQDAIKVCHATIRSVPLSVLTCLITNKDRISSKCKNVLTRYGY